MNKVYRFKTCVPQTDCEAIIDLFDAVKDELYLPDRTAVANMVQFIFEHGGIAGSYYQGRLVGALGYFFGDPAEGFFNKSVLFLYVGAILPEHRGTRLFSTGLTHILKQMQGTAVRQIRLQAEATNSFTNRLYGRFARRLGPGKSLRGKDVMTYGASIDQALAALSRPRRPFPAKYNPTPRHHFTQS